MHPSATYIKSAAGELLKDPIKRPLSFVPVQGHIIYHNKVKATVMSVTIDLTPDLPAIVINAVIK